MRILSCHVEQNMNVYIKGLNACAMRRQKLAQYAEFLTSNRNVLVSAPELADIILVWSCGFRADHRDSSLGKIRHYLSTSSAKIVVSGCLPDIAPELLEFPTDRVVVANWKNDTAKLDAIFGAEKSAGCFDLLFTEERLCVDAAQFRKENPGKDATFHDQFIKLLVSEGCGFKCAYCSERLAFPPYRSFPVERLYEACKRMVEKTGVHEVILLADSLGQYGSDIGANLPALIRKLHTIDHRMKFALNNLHLMNFTEYLDDMESFLASGLIRHLNLPIQSASDRLLRYMNRLYCRADIERAFSLLEQLGFSSFDTHIIVGHPGEKERDLEETLDLLIKYKPQYVLVSKYMGSLGAPSAKLPDQVDEATAMRRLLKAAQYLVRAGIICNCDGSELSRSRMERLHRD